MLKKIIFKGIILHKFYNEISSNFSVFFEKKEENKNSLLSFQVKQLSHTEYSHKEIHLLFFPIKNQ